MTVATATKATRATRATKAGDAKKTATAATREAKAPAKPGTRWDVVMTIGETTITYPEMTASELRRAIVKAVKSLAGYKGGRWSMTINGPEMPAPKPSAAAAT